MRFSIPGWMLSMWEADYGKEKAEQISASFLKERPLTVRFNTSRASVEEILKSLESQGIAAEPTGFLDTVYSISGYDHLEAVEAFYEGLMTVQDPSSALAAHLAGIKAGGHGPGHLQCPRREDPSCGGSFKGDRTGGSPGSDGI